jgi:hypothetical protein
MRTRQRTETTGKVRIPRPVHPFAARMAASIPWKELRRATGRRLRVLDAMAGSGTTVVVARALGHEASGFDTDPLAVLLARVWCTNVNEAATLRVAREVRDKAKRLSVRIPTRDAYPVDADEETREFVRYWFDRTNRHQLAALARTIAEVSKRHVREILWCAFSRLIITKQAGASLALDVAHSRPHKVSNKTVIRPIAQFETAVRAVVSAIPFRTPHPSPRASIRRADARKLPVDGPVGRLDARKPLGKCYRTMPSSKRDSPTIFAGARVLP